jgi:CAP12/Pycsar effector protein, TIR domain
MEKTLLAQAKSIRGILASNVQANRNTHYEIGESLNALRNAALGLVEAENRVKLESLILPLKIRKDAPYTIESKLALIICDQIISIIPNSNDTSASATSFGPIERYIPKKGRIFIVHGHDMTNTLRLRTLIKERFNLVPVILSEQPSKGRSIIEKFEAEAEDSSYAFVIITPDDFISKDGDVYTQARPNVLFELGWFYGRLGRERVCILYREGTAIPSDLGGIIRIQFGSSIEEKLGEIENELKAARLIEK